MVRAKTSTAARACAGVAVVLAVLGGAAGNRLRGEAEAPRRALQQGPVGTVAGALCRVLPTSWLLGAAGAPGWAGAVVPDAAVSSACADQLTDFAILSSA